MEYKEFNVQDLHGNAVRGASVLIKTYPAGVTATIYDVNGVSILNPMTTDSTGQCFCRAANGDYSKTISKTGIVTETTNDVTFFDPSDYFLQYGSGAVNRSILSRLQDNVNSKDFGAIGDGVTVNDAAILSAITSLRANAVNISDGLPTPTTITAYSSGVLEFGRGVFVVSPDVLDFTQDLGLTIRGQGSRGSNNSVRAATTILISGTSSGFGIRVKGNGARALRIQDLDICYATSGFTGNLLDIYSAPDVSLDRVFIGTFGLTSVTRLQTAKSCLRTTYDEFLNLNNVVMDGAIDGIWFDDVRDTGAFGGSMTTLTNVVFYDFTGRHIRHDGARTRQGLSINTVSFNPISVDPTRCLDLNNVEGLSIISSSFVPSVANKPSSEWMRLVNCTGNINASVFDDLAKAGTIDGILSINGNRVFSTDGFTLKGGVITGRSNEFSKGTAGFTMSPTYNLCADLGPDLFKADVTRSYDIPADSTNLAVNIHYDRANDSSTSGFRNTSSRVQIKNLDEKLVNITDATYTISILDTGRTILANGGVAQAFTLPAVTPRARVTITKVSAQDLSVTCAGGTNFYGVGSTFPTVASLTGAAMGTLVLEGYATIGWIVKSQVSTWVYS